MQQPMRLKLIMTQLKAQKTLTIHEVMALTGSSRDTARRDIIKLTANDAAERNYGGLSLPNTFNKIDDFLSRRGDLATVKQKLGQTAARLVTDQQRLFLDNSTTISTIPAYLPANDQVLAVTNSLDIADQLLRKTTLRTQLLGGTYLATQRGTMDTTALHELTAFNLDLTFISAAGLTATGVYYAYLEDVAFKKQLRDQSKKLVLVLDHTRILTTHNYLALSLDQLDYLITDELLPEQLSQRLATAAVQVIYSKELS